jgi:hypothetical protein
VMSLPPAPATMTRLLPVATIPCGFFGLDAAGSCVRASGD